MIRGIDKVIKPRDMEAGRFYLAPGYNEKRSLFQCIRTNEEVDGEPLLMGLVFTVGEKTLLSVDELPYQEPVVALPDVHIRVDPPSLIGSSMSTSMSAGMFLIQGEEAFVAASSGRFGWTLINITTGRIPPVRLSPYWLTFSRWSLVVDEADQEVTIASFGADTE